MIEVIDLARKFASFDDRWSPRIVAELNGQHVRIAKLEGPFVWHRHEHEDELFLVHRGTLEMHLRDAAGERVERIGPGQLLVVPRGVEHMPVAPETVEVLLFEPATTINTGDADDPRRIEQPPRA